MPDCVLLNSCSCDVFVLVRILTVTFHGHDHEERPPSPLRSFEQPANRVFQRSVSRPTEKLPERLRIRSTKHRQGAGPLYN